MDVFKIPVFPAADLLPMLGAEELQELAEDIFENGQHDAIVVADIELDGGIVERQVVDGRNRLAACKLAGVDPKIRVLNGEDPTAYVLSANLRRHNTKGQRAVFEAMLRPKGAQGKRTDLEPRAESARSDNSPPPSVRYIKMARTVLRESDHGDLANDVLSGAVSLDAAYADAKKRKLDREEKETRADRLKALEARYSDLASAVTDGQMDLNVAVQKADERDAERQQLRWAATTNLVDALGPLDRAPEIADKMRDLYDSKIAEQRGASVTYEKLERASAYLAALAISFRKEEPK